MNRAGGLRGKRTSHSTVLAVITAGHVAVIYLAMLVKAPQTEAAPPGRIVVSMLTEQRIEPPLPQLAPPEVALPEVLVPPVMIDIQMPAETPPPATVAVAPPPPAPAAVPPAPTPSKGDTSEPIMATSVEYVRQPVLVYPAAAKQARATGTVQVRAVVETDGRVREAHVHRSSGHASLDKAAIEAMLTALFKPYTRDGIARAAVVIVPMEFGLKTRTVPVSR